MTVQTIPNYYAAQKVYGPQLTESFNNVLDIASNPSTAIIVQGLVPSISGTNIVVSIGNAQAEDVTLSWLNSGAGQTIPLNMGLSSTDTLSIATVTNTSGYIVLNAISDSTTPGNYTYNITTSLALATSLLTSFPTGSVVGQVCLGSYTNVSGVVTVNSTGSVPRISYGLTTPNIAYNAATNTPPISSMVAGQTFNVTNTGRITGVQIVGALVGSDSFVIAGDQIYYNGSSYQLVNSLIQGTTLLTVKIGTLNNSAEIYFTSFNENNDYLNQRRFLNTGINTLFDTSYDGTEPVDQINIYHLDGIRWLIQGNVVATTTITALASTSGTVGNQSPVYTLSSATGFAVGQVVNIDAETAVDNATTDTLGCNSGAFKITGLSGTAMTVNNCNTMKDVLVPSDFSGATATVVTTIKARIRITAPGLIIANLNHLNDNATTSPIIYVRESTVLFTGIWSAATTTASTLSVSVAQFNNCKILDSIYDADGIPTSAKLIVSGKTSSTGNLLDQFNNSTISVAELIGPGVLSFYSSDILTQSIFSPVNFNTSNMYLSGNIFTNNASTGINNGIQVLGGDVNVLGLHVSNNNNANGTAVQGGYLKVASQQCNNNGAFGNISTSGSMFIRTQLNCNGNVSANFSAQQGGFLQINTLTNSTSSGTNISCSGGGTINVTTMPSADSAYTGELNISKGSKILVAKQANWTLNTGTFGIQNTDASFIG